MVTTPVVVVVAVVIMTAPAVALAVAIIVAASPVDEAAPDATWDARRRVAVVDEDRPAPAPATAVVPVILRARGDERGQRKDDQEHCHLKELSRHHGVLLPSTGVNALPRLFISSKGEIETVSALAPAWKMYACAGLYVEVGTARARSGGRREEGGGRREEGGGMKEDAETRGHGDAARKKFLSTV
jgi:hypothetical protein